MSAYNFQSAFVDPLLKGEKGTTIRADRKDGRRPQLHERFIAYTGMRTKKCRKLFESTIESVKRVKLSEVVGESEFEWDYDLIVGGVLVMLPEADAIARKDGFKDFETMVAWFEKNHGLPFSGWLIQWKPIV